MPHRQPILLSIGRVLVTVALCAPAACRGERTRAAQVDTTTGSPTVVVPVRTNDPALQEATVALDSLARNFARARASVDSEARVMRDANRLDSAYGVRYDAFERRRAAAAELRAARDRAQRVRDALATRATRAPPARR